MTRLIDADALKEKAETVTLWNGEVRRFVSYETIDNAPTVPLPDFKDGYKQAIRDGKTNFSRPKGKWQECINEKWGGTTIYCPYCKEEALEKDIYVLRRQVKSNFCPNCGADMREV